MLSTQVADDGMLLASTTDNLSEEKGIVKMFCKESEVGLIVLRA